MFIVSLSLLVFELLLTRIFSVSLWYHFAFFAISIALFGLGAGGIFVQAFPQKFPEKTISDQLALSCLALGLTMLFPAFLLLRVDFPARLFLNLSGHTFVFLSIIFLFASLPFFFGGVMTSLLFKHFPDSIGKLYCADLVGASTGCLLTFILLELFGGPTAILLNATLASLGGLFFLKMDRAVNPSKSLFVSCVLAPCILAAFVGYHGATSAFDLKFAKGFDRSKDEFSKWNSISRVAVFDCAIKASAKALAIYVWGVSQNFDGPFPEIKCIDIDAQAGTFLTRFQGDWESVAYTQYDPPSLVHRLREHPETLIIGAGGGKDVLAALSLGAKHVTAVELNPIIVNDIMLRRYKEFSGSLYQHPKVTAVAAEGRSYLHGRKERYDVIQLAFVDTSAATSGGAYILAENNLYTVEAFVEYLFHLKPDGIFSVSWVDVPGLFGGTRLVSLGLAALERSGVKEIDQHMIVLSHAPQPVWFIRTVLLKRSPFTEAEEKKVAALCQALGFKITYSPHYPGKTFISKLILTPHRDELYRSLPVDISPTTDDRPFFFYQDRFSQLLNSLRQKKLPGLTYGVGLQLLSRTLLVTFLLVILFFIGPLILLRPTAQGVQGPDMPRSLPFLVYFSCLGFGFICLEIGLLQKFLLFLGHPFYTLSTTLLAILLFAGLGSLATQRFLVNPTRFYIKWAIALLALTVSVYIWGLPQIFTRFIGCPTWVKVGLTLLLLMPVGLLLGMPLPLGIKTIQGRASGIIPWVWGLNGGTSVLGSVVAMILAMNFGYNITLLTGLGIYLIAFVIAHLAF